MKGMDLQMAQKKRIRDRLFPEGGKIRSYLRTTNRFVKSMFSIDYLKEQKRGASTIKVTKREEAVFS